MSVLEAWCSGTDVFSKYQSLHLHIEADWTSVAAYPIVSTPLVEHLCSTPLTTLDLNIALTALNPTMCKVITSACATLERLRIYINPDFVADFHSGPWTDLQTAMLLHTTRLCRFETSHSSHVTDIIYLTQSASIEEIYLVSIPNDVAGISSPLPIGSFARLRVFRIECEVKCTQPVTLLAFTSSVLEECSFRLFPTTIPEFDTLALHIRKHVKLKIIRLACIWQDDTSPVSVSKSVAYALQPLHDIEELTIRTGSSGLDIDDAAIPAFRSTYPRIVRFEVSWTKKNRIELSLASFLHLMAECPHFERFPRRVSIHLCARELLLAELPSAKLKAKLGQHPFKGEVSVYNGDHEEATLNLIRTLLPKVTIKSFSKDPAPPIDDSD
jgi:hypothetical protein